ncbi:MAG TPA: glycoside hydrolase family 3 C-terminal domain-containing protein [Verrucomicrobiota bacterium]|nr:glycoside hydrolase family 3 C-terminal domain-containing protein [Verrucomicrobiota bacterium]HPU55075.1 glycoside hydrolase family 3 C-terminal domain-containing protein [Verrucomicrobiota bacterium]
MSTCTRAFATAAAGLCLAVAPAPGANYVMTGSDAIGTSSFNTGLHWPGGIAPAPGNTYQTAAYMLRTPEMAGSLVFEGDSLEVQSGGTLRHKTAGTITIDNLILDEGATLELTRPNGVNSASAEGALAGSITLNGTAVFRAGISTDVSGQTFTISSAIGGAGGFRTDGSTGNIILTGDNTYEGLTVVSAGTLGGCGTIRGPVVVAPGGAISLGSATNRTLTISNELTLGGNLILRIGKSGATLTSDRLRGISTVHYGGALTLVAAGDMLSAGDSFQLIEADHYSGQFAAYHLPPLPQGLKWDLTRLSSGSISVTNAPLLYLDPSLPIETRVADLISFMTLQEKATQLFHNGAVNERLGIPNYGGWNQCLHGVSYSKPTTLFPVSIAAAATWDPDLIRAEADAIASEARAYHVSDGKGLIYRAPVINISRNPFWGRIQECYGEDPWLTSRIGVSYLEGLQGTNARYLKLAGTLKHFAVNNVERDRFTLSASVPERWLHEYWLPHWKDCAIEGRAQSIMAAYNRINGIHCAVNTNLLTDILRSRWGYKGFVVSDLGGIGNMVNASRVFATVPEAVAAALSAGCDYDDEQYRDGIVEAVTSGRIPEAVVDQALSRVLTTAFRLGVFDPPSMVPYSSIDLSVVRSPAHQDLALRVAQASMVLLKNENHILPLDRGQITNIAVIGPLAETFVKGNYYSGTPVNPITPRQGLLNRAGPGVQIAHAVGCGISTAGTPAQISEAAAVAAGAQAVVLCLGTDGSIEGEANDREFLELTPAQQSLLETVYAANTNLILVLINAGPLAIPWAATNVPAIIEAWYAGEKGGDALADVIFGDVNPGGRLPYTVYPSSTVPGLPPQDEYDVSKGYTYMFFTNQALFPFGHGLSYTTFGYSNLVCAVDTGMPDRLLEVSVDVQNTGFRAGDEVVQVYVRNTANNVVHPIKKLVGFKRIRLEPGETETVTLAVSADQLAHFDDSVAHDFVVDSGDYVVMVGSSSADIRLSSTVNLSLPPVLLPGIPGGFAAVLYRTNVALEWNAVSRAESYTVRRSLSPDGDYEVIASGLNALSFTDTNAVMNATNYYVVTAVNAAGESAPSGPVAVEVVPYVPPPDPPSGLSISAIEGRITLSWNASSNATSYRVKRSLSDFPTSFSVVASVAETSHVDVVTNSSLTWFYQVAAVNSGGESLPVTGSVKLSQAPTPPWFETDVGLAGLAGGSSIEGGTIIVQGAGATIYGTADGFHYLYVPLTGDGTLMARVVSTMPTSDLSDGWDKAGVMIRETLQADSRYCMAMMTSGQGGAFQYRVSPGANTERSQVAGLSCPHWVKLVRSGSSVTAYYSADGNVWTAFGPPVTLAMPSTVYAGLAVSARNVNRLDPAVFDNVGIFGVWPPKPSMPTGVSAVGGDGQVLLTWAAAEHAAGYNVKRAMNADGAYQTVAANIADLEFTDAGLSNGTLYHYVVAGINIHGEGPGSAPVSARPVSLSPVAVTALTAEGLIKFSWPQTHFGWRLEAQTNPITSGLGREWFTVQGSDLTNQISVPVDGSNPSVFFRLVYP